jgi:hypothetical protein
LKLPQKIVGRHKIRDAQICLLWDREGLSPEEIGEKFHLTFRRILQILRANHLAMPIDKEWEKRKRIALLRRNISRKPASQKDVADLIEQLRKEIEGDKPAVEINQYTNIWNRVAEKAKEVDAEGRVHLRDKTEV